VASPFYARKDKLLFVSLSAAEKVKRAQLATPESEEQKRKN